MLELRLHLPLAALVSVVIAAPPAAAFEPHPDCSFTPKEVPLVRSCETLRGNYDGWWGRHNALMNSLQELQMAISDPANSDAFVDALKGVANPIPTDSTGAATWLAGQRWPVLSEIMDKIVNPGQVLYTFITGVLEGSRAQIVYDEIEQAAAFARSEMMFYKTELDFCEAERRKEQLAANKVILENRRGLPKYPPDHPLCRPPEDASGPSDDGGGATERDDATTGDQTAGGGNTGGTTTDQDATRQDGGSGSATSAVAAESAVVGGNAVADDAAAQDTQTRVDEAQTDPAPVMRSELKPEDLQNMSARDLHNLVAEIERGTAVCANSTGGPGCFQQAASDLDLIVDHLGGADAATDPASAAFWASQLSTIYKALGEATR